MSNRIVVFEDKDENREEFKGALDAANAEKEAEVEFFDWDADVTGTYEEVLSTALSGDERPRVVVSDHDLSQMEGRLTDDVLEPVCQRLLIPLLRYAQQGPDSPRDRFARHVYGDLFHIRLSIEEGFPSAAQNVFATFRGFENVRTKLEQIGKDAVLSDGPAVTMAQVLGREDIRVDLTLYSSSGPQMIAKNPPDEIFDNLWLEVQTYNLGHWLLNSILRYPGILLNEVAAAAYMNLSIGSFRDERIQEQMEGAKYDGPFSDLRPSWWRSLIDAKLDAADVEDGYVFAGECGIEDAAPSIDIFSGEPNATYYCIINKAPVKKANSFGNLSWIPQGADLARISKDTYETWAPLFSR